MSGEKVNPVRHSQNTSERSSAGISQAFSGQGPLKFKIEIDNSWFTLLYFSLFIVEEKMEFQTNHEWSGLYSYLCVDPVALSSFVPVDKALLLVANAFSSSFLAVVGKQEGVIARALLSKGI